MGIAEWCGRERGTPDLWRGLRGHCLSSCPLSPSTPPDETQTQLSACAVRSEAEADGSHAKPAPPLRLFWGPSEQ